MVVNLAIDGNVLAHQPSSLTVGYAEAPEETSVNGGVLNTPYTHSKTLSLEFQDKDSDNHGMIQELETARGGVRAHRITWTDPSGVAQEMWADWDANPDYTIIYNAIFGPVTVELKQRPDTDT